MNSVGQDSRAVGIGRCSTLAGVSRDKSVAVFAWQETSWSGRDRTAVGRSGASASSSVGSPVPGTLWLATTDEASPALGVAVLAAVVLWALVLVMRWSRSWTQEHNVCKTTELTCCPNKTPSPSSLQLLKFRLVSCLGSGSFCYGFTKIYASPADLFLHTSFSRTLENKPANLATATHQTPQLSWSCTWSTP